MAKKPKSPPPKIPKSIGGRTVKSKKATGNRAKDTADKLKKLARTKSITGDKRHKEMAAAFKSGAKFSHGGKKWNVKKSKSGAHFLEIGSKKKGTLKRRRLGVHSASGKVVVRTRGK